MRPLTPAVACALLLLLLRAGTSSATGTHANIEVLPANVNKTIFEEGSFRRTCRYTGSGAVSQLHILHNEQVIDTESQVASIMLDVDPAQLSDAGTYTCQVVFADSPSITASMGTLTVVDLGLITAPVDQYVVEGEDVSLECSFLDPDQVYGIVVITIRREGRTTPIISGASVADEGDYRCDISLISHDDSTQVPIRLHVFTPINITDFPVIYQELYGVQEATFSVRFTGRQSQGLQVKWFRNGIELFSAAERRISTFFSEETRTGNTSISFPQMDRGDKGVYRVLVSTEFGEGHIEQGPRRDDWSFQVVVKVYPPNPVGFKAALVTEHQAELQWELPISHPDQDVDSFQLQVSYPNGSTALSESLDRSARSAVVSVFPGITYDATLTATNTDGGRQSTLTFSTPPAAPYVTQFEARRLNETHFNISISLLYTGGGETTIFSVYFREQHTVSWSSQPVMVVVIDSTLALEYHGVISGEQIRGKGPLEFELRVENGLGFMNRTGSGLEISDLPGAPTTPVIAEKSDTSVTLDFKLPEEGTPPFINIILEFSEPQVMARNYTGTYHPGQTVVKEVRDLSPRTVYSLKARAVNYAGNGPSSKTINFTTNEPPPTTTPTTNDTTTPTTTDSMTMMMPIIYGAAGGVAVIFLISASVTIFCCCCCCCQRRRQKKTYKVDEKHAKDKQDTDPETGADSEKEKKSGRSSVPISLHPPSSASSLETLEKKPRHIETGGNIYFPVPQHDRRLEGPPSIVSSSSPSTRKWKLEQSPNQASCSTLNSGGSATQDSFVKKPDLLSATDSDIQLSSLQSSQPSHRTSRDSLGFYRRQKGVNPSISSGGSETTTETTDRYQTTPFLTSSIGETYSSSQTMPFIPQGVSFTSLPYSDHTQTQYSMDQPQSQITEV